MSQAKAYQRLLDLALTLTSAGRVGVRSPDLMTRLGYEDSDAGKRAFMRDLDDLRGALKPDARGRSWRGEAAALTRLAACGEPGGKA
mgnify:CR=1 FL=1